MFWLPLLLSLSGPALAKTVTLDWDIGWVTAAPDGYTRPVIGINGEWPPPVLEADVGDTITVNVRNSLGNETTGIHWHGMWMRGQNEQQQSDDRYQCHRWAVDQTHYDPTDSEYDRDDRSEYDRAISACLTGRGYSVK